MIAIEAKYHSKCLAALYNKARSDKQVCNESDDSHLHGIAFAELVAFMEDFHMEQNISPVFKLADLAKLYQTCLEEFGGSTRSRVHTSRLKHRLLLAFPDIRAYMQGRSVMLTFDDDIYAALKKACDHDSDDDAMHLARAARVVRKEMFDWKFTFTGSFGEHDSVPHSLLALVNMVMEGPNIKHQYRANTKAAVSISQLLIFKHARAAEASATYHALEQETPLPLYLAMKIHAVTRKRSRIDTLFHLGICVSYDRLLLLFIRSIREGNFQQYMKSLTAIVPWMFALDHTHYSRWLSVHIRDMVSLKEMHLAIFAEFCAGKLNKTGNKFSAMALDQCHELNNATVKESGGAIGLLTNPSALRRWMVAGPEIARMVSEFETKPEAGEHLHHEQCRGVQETFLKEVKSLVPVIETWGILF